MLQRGDIVAYKGRRSFLDGAIGIVVSAGQREDTYIVNWLTAVPPHNEKFWSYWFVETLEVLGHIDMAQEGEELSYANRR